MLARTVASAAATPGPGSAAARAVARAGHPLGVGPAAGRQPLRAQGMRAGNLALLLSRVPGGGASRAQLAAATGLTKSSVSGIVRDLLDAGFLAEGGQFRGGVPGRPGTVVRLDGDHFAGLGLAFGVGTISACVVDLGHRVRVRHVRDLDNRRLTPEQVFTAVGELAAEALAGARDLGLTVVGSALAAPGPVDDVRGVLRHAPNLGWSEVGIRELLVDCLAAHEPPGAKSGSTPGLPTVENEAHLAALGEQWFGQGRRLGDYVSVFGDIGIGGAIVVDGDVFRGSAGLAGELGHVVVDPVGDRCGCGGRGCLETVVGIAAIARRAGIADEPGTSPRGGGAREPLAALRRALVEGQPQALEAAGIAGATLGRALASVVDVVDPHAVVIGGSLSTLRPWLAESVRRELDTHAMPRARTPPEIVWSDLGSAAAVLGAAGLIVARALSDPAPLLLTAAAT